VRTGAYYGGQQRSKGILWATGHRPFSERRRNQEGLQTTCKTLHPDLNRDVNAKARFQAISEAYGVLSDPDLRRAYDALQYTNPEPQKSAAELEPICCSRCGKVTAQPRSTVFYRVVSFVLLTTRTPIQGIFCSECAKRVGLQATLVSAFVGWWGFPWGPIWTISSVFRNAFGGSYSKDVDEKLLWYNALAFLSKGKLAISYALAQQVRTARDSEIAINAVKLMDHLRAAGVPATSPMLKNPWNTTPLNLGAHLALLVAIPGAIGLAVYLDNTKGASIPSSVRPSYQASLPTRASPASGAAAWPPPPVSANAVSSIPTCAFPPRNGEILLRHGIWGKEGHAIEIINGSNGNAIIKVKNAFTGSLVVSFFVAKGATASLMNIPDGGYRVQYAFGEDLQGDCHSFVRTLAASQFPGIETLETRYTSTEVIYSQLSYTLFSVRDGNVRPQALDVAAFNAD
jgi:DnaJ domain